MVTEDIPNHKVVHLIVGMYEDVTSLGYFRRIGNGNIGSRF